jgi:hypothetical protein
MDRLLLFPALAVGCLLFWSCDGETPTEPASDASFGVTAEGLVTNTFQVKASCASGYTGTIRYEVAPYGATFGIDCPGGTALVDAAGVTGFRLDYYDFNPAVGSGCQTQIFYTLAAGDFPVRDKCTVNGRLMNGKPIAKATIKYVK